MGILHYETAQNTTGSTYCWSSKVTNPAIGICDANGKITYVGCKSSNVDHYDVTNGSVIYRYYYSSSKPTIQAIAANGDRLYGFNTYTSILQADIPAGTYVGQSAYNTFHSYISNNGYRKLAESVTIRHMNITKTFSAGQYVSLSYAYGGNVINLTFGNYNSSSSYPGDAGVNNYKEWWTTSASYPTIQLRYNLATGTWSSNSFYLLNGIRFV